jgi:hypothetical protein
MGVSNGIIMPQDVWKEEVSESEKEEKEEKGKGRLNFRVARGGYSHRAGEGQFGKIQLVPRCPRTPRSLGKVFRGVVDRVGLAVSRM